MAYTANRKQNVDRLQQIWSALSIADREVILGHSEEVLSQEDRAKLLRTLRALGEAQRKK